MPKNGNKSTRVGANILLMVVVAFIVGLSISDHSCDFSP
jgi:hypothetical protein